MVLVRCLAALALCLALPAAAQKSDLDLQLWRAVDKNDLAQTRLLLERGADPNYDTGRERILLRALFRKYWAVADALLDAGASLKIPDRAGCEQLHSCDSVQAALFASFEPSVLAKLKSRGLDLDTVGASGHTALTRLVVDTPMAIRAVGGATAYGAARSAVTGEVVITQAPPMPRVADIPPADNALRMKALLDAGADPNRKYRQLTPLMVVLGTHDRPPAMSMLLIGAGGRIEHDSVVTPMKAPAPPRPVRAGGSMLMVDPDNPAISADSQGVLDGMRVGPLGWAVMMRRADVAAQLLNRDLRIVEADRNLVYFAADFGEWNLVLQALRRQAAANVENRAGVTPLMLAADAGRVDVVRELIAAKADVNARSARTWPPLLERKLGEEIGSAIAGHSRGKPRLVGGYTALQVATERGHSQVMGVLRQAGAR